MTVVARHFALMTEAGFENMTPSCITSFGIYTEILHTWETHPEWEEKTRDFYGKPPGANSANPKTWPIPQMLYTNSGMKLPLSKNTI